MASVSWNDERSTGTGWRQEIMPNGPFDFALALRYLLTWRGATFERVDATTYRRALRLDGRDVLLSVRAVGSVERPRLLLDVAGDEITSEVVDAAESVVRRVFSLDHDPKPFLDMAEHDPVIAPLVAPMAGLRPVAIPDLYEALLWAVIGQQINVTFARTLKLRLVELCGRSLTIDGTSYPLMPTPEDVTAVDPALLAKRQFSRQKIAYVIGLSEAIADGELELSRLPTMPLDDAIAYLMSFKGIGRWTAEYVMMRGVGHTDALPAGDVNLQLVIGKAVRGRRVSEAELREIARGWEPWRGWVAFYFWAARQFAG